MKIQLLQPLAVITESKEECLDALGGFAQREGGNFRFSGKLAESAPAFQFVANCTGDKVRNVTGYVKFPDESSLKEQNEAIEAVVARLTAQYGEPQKKYCNSRGDCYRIKWISDYIFLELSLPGYEAVMDYEEPEGGEEDYEESENDETETEEPEDDGEEVLPQYMYVAFNFTDKLYMSNKSTSVKGSVIFGAGLGLVMLFTNGSRYGFGAITVALCVFGGVVAGVLFYFISKLFDKPWAEIPERNPRKAKILEKGEISEGLGGYEKKYEAESAYFKGDSINWEPCNLYLYSDCLALTTARSGICAVERVQYRRVERVAAEADGQYLELYFADGEEKFLKLKHDLLCDEAIAFIKEKQKA